MTEISWFETERLRVFTFEAKPSDICRTRRFFVACRTDCDCPFVVAHVTVWVNWPADLLGAEGFNWVEMIDVVDTGIHRQQGLATELWLGIEKYLGKPMTGDAVTPEGEKLLARVSRERNPIHLPATISQPISQQ